MTLKQIMTTRPEIAKRVMEKYPLNKAERRGCESEKAKREFLRSLYAKRLMVEEKEKMEYVKDDMVYIKPNEKREKLGLSN